MNFRHIYIYVLLNRSEPIGTGSCVSRSSVSSIRRDMFLNTKHEAISMKQTTPRSDEVWYVDSGVSNNMTSQKECFSYLEKPMQPGVSQPEMTLHIRSQMSVKFP